MTLTTKILAVLVGLGLAAGAGVFAYSRIFDSGLTAGRAEVQAKWDKDRLRMQKLIDAAAAENAKNHEVAAVRDQEAEDAYNSVVQGTAAVAAAYARSLHDYENRLAASSNAVSISRYFAKSPTAADVSGPRPIDAAIGARLAECDQHEAAYQALISELTPQVRP